MYGFSPNQLLQTHPFNGRTTIGVLILSVSVALELAYFFQEAHSFLEYSQVIYMIGAGSMVYITFWNLLIQMDALFKLITAMENMFDGKTKHSAKNVA